MLVEIINKWIVLLGIVCHTLRGKTAFGIFMELNVQLSILFNKQCEFYIFKPSKSMSIDNYVNIFKKIK